MKVEEFKDKLTPEQQKVLIEKGTEMPFTGKYVHTKDNGMYACAACGNELFASDTKFDSFCGWPAFNDVKKMESVILQEDTSYGMIRTEVLCAKCGGHLGHVFDLASQPTGKWYCINSASLDFKPEDDQDSHN